MTDKPNVIVICGPTGIGKTAAAINVAEAFGGQIISADSMQIYRYMDIGTAKPTPEEKARVPHYMIDIVDPDEDFDAAMFAEIARKKIAELHENHIPAIVAGGTGFYIKSLVHGLFQGVTADSEIRTRLKQEAEVNGGECLHERLRWYDPDTAAKIHPHDIFRIVRAIEVYELTGKPLSEYHETHQFAEEPFHVLKIGLDMEREMLYERINRRVDAMIAAGFENEVRKLLDMGYSPELKSMQSIGYRHLAEFIQGKMSYEEAVRTLRRDTRRYAKRQMTWFKADPQIIWIPPENSYEIRTLVKKKFSHLINNVVLCQV